MRTRQLNITCLYRYLLEFYWETYMNSGGSNAGLVLWSEEEL